MQQVVLSAEQNEAALAYAEAAAINHMAYGRDIETVKKHIYIGKRGEIAYCLMFGIPLSEVAMDATRTVDPGYDMIVNGEKIDVKTTSLPLDKVRFNPNYAHCDKYVIMAIDKSTQGFVHVNTMEKSYALRNAHSENGMWFWKFGKSGA